MANVDISGSSLGSSLQQLLMCDDIEPGSDPSYQLCKLIYLYHPLGAKIAEAPIKMAQSQEREITIPKGPEERLREAFVAEWGRLQVSKIILNVMTQARVYGIASVAMLAKGTSPNQPIPPEKIASLELSFNVLDPLNTAGSLVQSQQPNALDFQKHYDIVVSGQVYHRSRTCTMLNEQPIYIAWTSSSYGYVGRSVYQRCLFPLKSFVQSMVTDDMVTKKAGVLIAKMAQPGSIIDNPVIQFFAGKRQLLKEAENGNVISVAPDEAIETLNMQNIDGAFGMARKDILENIAVSADMPAKLLNAETFAEGFGEGTEDAKNVARYIDRTRIEMQPLYDYFDPIVMRRAWNPDFYKSIQADFPEEYGSRTYEDAFYAWKNSFASTWPSLLTEPDSEKARTDEVRLKALIAAIQVLVPGTRSREQGDGDPVGAGQYEREQVHVHLAADARYRRPQKLRTAGCG